MAVPKKSNKIFDVAKPGKTAASPSSRPLVVSNRPILKDPMMADRDNEAKEEASTEDDNKKTTPSAGEKVISVPEETDFKEPQKDEKNLPKEDDEQKTEEKEDLKDTPEDNAVIDSIGDEEPKTNHDPNKPGKSEEEKQRDSEVQDESVKKLIEEKKYFVPIGEVTRRRANRHAEVVLLIFIIMAIAAFYLLADAEIINAPFDLPYDIIQNF